MHIVKKTIIIKERVTIMKKMLITGAVILIIVIAVLGIWLINIQAQNRQLQQINIEYEHYIR